MSQRTIAFFVSSHGFGHAARACALIEEIDQRAAAPVRFHIYSDAPAWFFEDSLEVDFGLISETVDSGLVQRTAIEIDSEASLRSIHASYPVADERLRTLGRRIRASGAELVVADISPLGLLCARETGLPSVLVENFTWDWIYRRLPLEAGASWSCERCGSAVAPTAGVLLRLLGGPLGQCRGRRNGRISTQVLKEYYQVVTRRLDPGLAPDQARADIRDLLTWQPLDISAHTMEQAWFIEDRYKFSWWDALIIASAQQAGCTWLLSENLQSDQKIGNLTILNPVTTTVNEAVGR